LQIRPPKPPKRGKQLGSSSEVHGFRGQSRHRLLVVRFSANKATEFLDELTVGPPVGGTDPHVDAAVQPIPAQVVWSNWTGVDLNRQHVTSSPRDDLQLRHESRHNVIADKVGQAFFKVQRFSYTAHVARTVLDTDKYGPPGGVGECDDGPEHSVWRRQVALELEGLALRAFEQIEKVHELGSIL